MVTLSQINAKKAEIAKQEQLLASAKQTLSTARVGTSQYSNAKRLVDATTFNISVLKNELAKMEAEFQRLEQLRIQKEVADLLAKQEAQAKAEAEAKRQADLLAQQQAQQQQQIITTPVVTQPPQPVITTPPPVITTPKQDPIFETPKSTPDPIFQTPTPDPIFETPKATPKPDPIFQAPVDEEPMFELPKNNQIDKIFDSNPNTQLPSFDDFSTPDDFSMAENFFSPPKKATIPTFGPTGTLRERARQRIRRSEELQFFGEVTTPTPSLTPQTKSVFGDIGDNIESIGKSLFSFEAITGFETQPTRTTRGRAKTVRAGRTLTPDDIFRF